MIALLWAALALAGTSSDAATGASRDGARGASGDTGASAVACQELATPPETLSVAWVSPVREGAGGREWLMVVPTTELRQWVGDDKPTVGRMLRHLGLRKREKEPKRRYKITIFDVRAQDLCRPVEGYDEGADVRGVSACSAGLSNATSRYSGCGYTTDQATGKRGLDVYRVRWRDAARDGFCVLPAERFVSEGGE